MDRYTLFIMRPLKRITLNTGWLKKVSCWHDTTAYFFWATLYIYRSWYGHTGHISSKSTSSTLLQPR